MQILRGKVALGSGQQRANRPTLRVFNQQPHAGEWCAIGPSDNAAQCGSIRSLRRCKRRHETKREEKKEGDSPGAESELHLSSISDFYLMRQRIPVSHTRNLLAHPVLRLHNRIYDDFIPSLPCQVPTAFVGLCRSEERRVEKECRSRWS